MADAVLDLKHWQFFEDDSSDPDTCTAIDSEDTVISRGTGTANRFMVRLLLDETASKAATTNLILQYELNNSGTWNNVTGTVVGITGGTPTDGDPCNTQLLTTPAGKSGTDWLNGKYEDTSYSISSFAVAKDNFTECQWCVYIVDADVSHNDTIKFRHDYGTGLATWTTEAELTVTKTTPGEVSEAASVAIWTNWDERFENVSGYDESWDGTTATGGSTLDPDFTSSSVTGAPPTWDDDCLELDYVASGACYLNETFSPYGLLDFWFSIDLILNTYTGNTSYLDICEVRRTAGTNFTFFSADTNNGQWRSGIWDGTTLTIETVGTIELDKLYRVEFHWNPSSSVARLYVNGVQKIQKTLSGDALTTKLYGLNVGEISPAHAATYYADNILVTQSRVWNWGEVAETASANICLPGESSSAASINISSAGEVSKTASLLTQGPNFTEGFEAVGYDEAWSQGEGGNTSLMDPDYPCSSINAPSYWGSKCHETARTVTGQLSWVEHNPIDTVKGRVRVDFMVGSESLVTASDTATLWEVRKGSVGGVDHIIYAWLYNQSGGAGNTDLYLAVSHNGGTGWTYQQPLVVGKFYTLEVLWDGLAETYSIRLNGIQQQSGSLTNQSLNYNLTEWVIGEYYAGSKPVTSYVGNFIVDDATAHTLTAGEVSASASVNIATQIWNEQFENASGYDETWSEGENLTGTSVLDEDYTRTSVTGAPTSWGDDCLRMVIDATNDCELEHRNDGTNPVSYWRQEVILPTGGHSLGSNQYQRFTTLLDSTGNYILHVGIINDATLGDRLMFWVYHDGTSNLYYYTIDTDTPYCIEYYWNNTDNEWALRVNESTLGSGSLTSTATGWQMDRYRLGVAASASDYDLEVFIDNVGVHTGQWLGQTFTTSTAGEVSEAASVNIKVPSEVQETGSANVALPGETAETASANVALVSEVSEVGSVCIGYVSYIEEYFEDLTDYDYDGWAPSLEGTNTLAPNTATSGVTGAPLNWQDECCTFDVNAAADDCRITEDWSQDLMSVYYGVDLIVDSYTAADGQWCGITDAYSDGYALDIFHIDLFYFTATGLNLRVQVQHDGSNHSWDHPISLNTRYRVEIKWDHGTETWAYRLNGVVQQSGSLTSGALGEGLNVLSIGTSGQSFTAAQFYLDNITLGGEDYIAPDYNGQVAETGSANVALPGEIAETGSANVALQSETSSVGSALISRLSQFAKAASVAIALSGQAAETASANIALYGETAYDASTNIALVGETSSAASVNICLVGETAETASVTLKVPGETQSTASVNVTGTSLGQVAETASANIAAKGSVYDDASANVALRSEAANSASVDVALRSETSSTASITVALRGEVSYDASINISLGATGQVAETASVNVALRSQIFETASATVALRGEVAETASTDIKVPSETAATASIAICSGDPNFPITNLLFRLSADSLAARQPTLIGNSVTDLNPFKTDCYAGSIRNCRKWGSFEGPLLSANSGPLGTGYYAFEYAWGGDWTRFFYVDYGKGGDTWAGNFISSTVHMVLKNNQLRNENSVICLRNTAASNYMDYRVAGSTGRGYRVDSTTLIQGDDTSSLADDEWLVVTLVLNQVFDDPGYTQTITEYVNGVYSNTYTKSDYGEWTAADSTDLSIGVGQFTGTSIDRWIADVAHYDDEQTLTEVREVHAYYADLYQISVNGEAQAAASVNIKVPSEVAETGSANVALPSETQSAASVNVTGTSTGQVAETASANIAAKGSVYDDASANVALQSESADTASVNVALRSETYETASVTIKLYGQAASAASANIATSNQSEVFASASVDVALQSEAQSVASANVALQSETANTASINIALRGESSSAASVAVALAGQSTADGSVELAIRSQVAEAASADVALQSDTDAAASVEIALPSQVASSASINVELLTASQVASTASINVRAGGIQESNPNADVAVVGTWKDELGGTTNIYQSIDETRLDTDDYIWVDR